MLTGFNTNVRRLGLLFHVQTEDSGRAHPHVITHLFHQGTIVATEKQSYADQIDAESCDAEVRRRMQQQHKGMLIRLRDGELDARIRERLGLEALPEPPAADPAPGPAPEGEAAVAAGPAQPAPVAPRPGVPPSPPARPAASPPPARPAAAPANPAVPGLERSSDDFVLEYLAEKARKRTGR